MHSGPNSEVPPSPQPHSVADGAGPGLAWPSPLLGLAEELRQAAVEWRRDRSGGVKPVQQGEGDVSFGPDRAAEACLTTWFHRQAQKGPLSLLTEDQGWRHWGPGAEAGSVTALPDFDHGGPRISIDPIDGTRPWLHGLRSAWVVIAFAPPGPAGPLLSEVTFACVEEIPLPHAGWVRRLVAHRGAGCNLTEIPLYDQRSPVPRACDPKDTATLDHGFVSFFAFHPSVRAPIDRFAFQFLERVKSEHGLEIEHCYDDQYIASGGQLALMALGHYRMLCDLRPKIEDAQGKVTQCAKPYDVAGAVFCAREAGCVVLDLEGNPLDTPLDAQTNVGFVAYPGIQSAERFQGAFEITAAQFFSK